ncbi:hypothetical protein [Kitasatospora sp. NPDC056531]|uniref:hypothetical protein n=1 Tax=Kitasatospora sp. NPDC056531 TaxID=3345856 RepID=UPI0036938AD2
MGNRVTLTYLLSDKAVDGGRQDQRKELQRIQDVQATWNHLVGVAQQWQKTDDFEAQRWRRVRFYDAAAEENFRVWNEKVKQDERDSADFVSEYRIPGARDGAHTGGEFVVARDPDQAELWAVFEGSALARHWDGESWQHARFTGSAPYLFERETALAIAHQHAADLPERG